MQDVIVDGYNLLRTDPELMMLERAGLESAREALIVRLLNASGLKKARSITVVFDGHKGGYSQERSERRAGGRLTIIYSKLGESADEVIKRMAATRSGEAAQLRVITRDWEIKDAVGQAGASSGIMKRRPESSHSPSIESEKVRQQRQGKDEAGGWNHSTRKKGPAKRPKKSDRKSSPGSDIYW